MGRVFPEDQWSFSSELSQRRNHHTQGQQEIVAQVATHFHLPPDWWPVCSPASHCWRDRAYTDWSYMLWLSQLNQALGYKAEVEHFRRLRTDCSAAVPGCNMGQTQRRWRMAV